MTAVSAGLVVWDRLGRSLRPTYGARANAADSLDDLRRTRRARAEALEAMAVSSALLQVRDRSVR